MRKKSAKGLTRCKSAFMLGKNKAKSLRSPSSL